MVFGLATVADSSTHDFYKGKTIRFVVAFSPGGGFDTYTRAIARHFGKHVPGNPATIVANMTGAGGFIQANFMYQRAKPDGLTVGNNIGGLMLQQIMGGQGNRVRREAIRVSRSSCRRAPGLRLDQGERGNEPGPLVRQRPAGKTRRRGTGGTASDIARTMKAALALPSQVIDGYKGTANIRLAAESGELAEGCWAWESIKTTWRKGIESGEVKVVVQVMPKAHPELRQVPLAIDFTRTEQPRRLLKAAVRDIAVMPRLYFGPPETPQERVQILRKAFLETLKDPEFLAEADKTKLEIEPVSGEQIDGVVRDLFKLDAEMVTRLKAVLVPN